jgi:hypothetical protein
LIVFGASYAWIGVERTDGARRIVLRVVDDAANATMEKDVASVEAPTGSLSLRVSVGAGGVCTFSVGSRTLGPLFIARPGRWVGAKVGLFAAAPEGSRQTGHVTVRSFLVSR